MPGHVEITLDKSRRLRYDINAIADLEEKLGRGVGAMLSEEAMGLSTVRGLLWAGLKWEDRGLTVDRAGQLLQDHLASGGDLQAVGQQINQALQISGLFGKGDQGNVKAGAAT